MKKTWVIIILIVLLCITAVSFWSKLHKAGTPSTANTSANVVTSRKWIVYAESIVRAEISAPPASARLYAYVATAYYKTYEATHSEGQASLVTKDVINAVVPNQTATTSAQLVSMNLSDAMALSPEAKSVEDTLIARATSDGFSKVWDGSRPTGPQYWVGTNPVTPAAGSWEHWTLKPSDKITIPPPPVWGSAEQKAGLAATKKAAEERTPEQEAAINFWAGTPGTEAPGGIWQNVYFAETQAYNLSDEQNAYAQMVLSQTVADAFIECWKVKYIYWTRRPSMDDPSIQNILGMPKNPNFPSYLSGHSTVSRAAAEVLGALFPDKTQIWLADATEARDSRLWAGIHFPYDNAQGFALGESVGKDAVANLQIKALR